MSWKLREPGQRGWLFGLAWRVGAGIGLAYIAFWAVIVGLVIALGLVVVLLQGLIGGA